MEKILRCRDLGPDCDYVIHAKTEYEVFEKASQHAKKVHHMIEVPEEAMERARKAIHFG
jgi:predicted small metal-binding protein